MIVDKFYSNKDWKSLQEQLKSREHSWFRYDTENISFTISDRRAYAISIQYTWDLNSNLMNLHYYVYETIFDKTTWKKLISDKLLFSSRTIDEVFEKLKLIMSTNWFKSSNWKKDIQLDENLYIF